ncbi:arginine decarboxylase [Alteromonas genovensis]|uniref:arginine decarboxylase n=1 Tax=Alteromonas genovensis TaxID=471225 RepID=UPI002FE13EF7
MRGNPSYRPFDIEIFQNCILVTLRGHWDMGTNINYLVELSDILQSRKGKPFHLFVDMRSWSSTKTETVIRIKDSIQLDRRNQLSELWLEDDTTDANHIAQRYLENQPFTFSRTNDVTTFLSDIDKRVEPSVMAYVTSWIDTATPR